MNFIDLIDEFKAFGQLFSCDDFCFFFFIRYLIITYQIQYTRNTEYLLHIYVYTMHIFKPGIVAADRPK